MTLEEAKNLKVGQIIYQYSVFNADGSLRRWKVTSIKTWKTKPEKVLIGVKHGLYAYDKIDESHLDMVSL